MRMIRTARRAQTARRCLSDQPPLLLPRSSTQPLPPPPPQHSRSFITSDNAASAKHLLERLTELDKKLSYEGWHTLRWTSFFATLGLGLAWLFRDNVSKGAGDAASEVTRRTLEDEGVQQQASELARGVVYQLLNDDRALELSSQFIYTVLQRPQIQEATLMLVKDVLQRPETELVVRSLVSDVLTHPESAERASTFVSNLVALPATRQAMVQLIQSVLDQPHTKQMTSDFFVSVMASEDFVHQTNALGNGTTHYLLNDDALKQAAIAWMNAVLNDPALQSTAGDAVWAAVKGAFVPWGKPKNGKQQQQQQPVAVADLLKDTTDAAPATPAVVVVVAPEAPATGATAEPPAAPVAVPMATATSPVSATMTVEERLKSQLNEVVVA